MSADNWAICPRCVAKATAAADPEQFRTFREDYGFDGAENGQIDGRYAGGCRTCGLAVELRASKHFWPRDGAS